MKILEQEQTEITESGVSVPSVSSCSNLTLSAPVSLFAPLYSTSGASLAKRGAPRWKWGAAQAKKRNAPGHLGTPHIAEKQRFMTENSPFTQCSHENRLFRCRFPLGRSKSPLGRAFLSA